MDAISLAQFGFASALTFALLHSLWLNAVLGAAAALAFRAMTRASAALRHMVGMSFLVAMAIVPAVQFVRFWGAPAGDLNDGILPAVSAPRLGPSAQVFVQESSSIAPVVALFWFVGACMILLRHAGSLRAIAAMDRGASEALPVHWQQRVARMSGALGIARHVAVRLSDEVLTPCAARLLRPVIWLPISLLARAPAEQIEALLAHELAHIARKDWLWNGVQCVVEALLFFHPALWWLSRRIRQEREHACDDLAVAACGDPIALAEALTALECERHTSPRLLLSATGGSLMQRISRLLSGPPSQGRWGARAALGLLSIGGVLLVTQMGLAGGRMPELQIRSSTDGVLGPGDYREIEAQGLDKQRFYRASIDRQGGLTQVYREDGQPRPIDAKVSRWIEEVTRLSVPPAAHKIDLAAIEAEHRSGAARFPQMEEMTEYKSLLALIAVHPVVAGKVGQPAAAAGKRAGGNVRLSGGEGEADIVLQMAGPKGKADVAVSARLKDRIWNLDSLQLN